MNMGIIASSRWKPSTLRLSCFFYSDFDTWSSNILLPNIGSGTLRRNSDNSITGKFGLGVNIVTDGITANDNLNVYIANNKTDKFSFSIWLKEVNREQGVFSLSGSPSDSNEENLGFTLYVPPSQDRFDFGLFGRINTTRPPGDSTIRCRLFALPYLAGEWFHVAGYFDDTNVDPLIYDSKIWVNGNELTTFTDLNRGNINGRNTGNTIFNIGERERTHQLNNGLDELYLFKNHLINQTEVSFMYNNGIGRKLF
jgi:hypothetical protein